MGETMIKAEFLDESVVIQISVSYITAEYYGKIAAQLKALGKPIPTNDIWIAAHAVEASAKLISYDAHFQVVTDLSFDKLKKQFP